MELIELDTTAQRALELLTNASHDWVPPFSAFFLLAHI